eukprot:scaffold116876_cov25-Tisochrysis_lutea.AAC.1
MVSQGKLLCKACKTEVPLIKSSIKKHITTSKHEDNMSKLKLRHSADNEIKVFLSDYFRDNPDEAGGTNVSPETLVYRYRVVAACLKNGVPIEKLDGLRPIFEEAGKSLVHSSCLRPFIPKVEEQEIYRLRDELAKQFITIVFDGRESGGVE